jgi:K+ transporter
MIKFFRKIRQNLLMENKTGKYIKYAIGEIILVVIGILIALQINIWNEDRKSNEKATILIKNIIDDLSSDIWHMNQALIELKEQLGIVDSLIAKSMDSSKSINYDNMGLLRYSSDFRPKSQRNHTAAVNNLENESIRKVLQDYFIKEDQVVDIFMEYEKILHNEIRPYLRESGMHNLNSLYLKEDTLKVPMMLKPKILDKRLEDVIFQQLLYERRLKTKTFLKLLNELKMENQELIKILKSENK